LFRLDALAWRGSRESGRRCSGTGGSCQRNVQVRSPSSSVSSVVNRLGSRRHRLRRDLAKPSTDLRLHQLARYGHDRLAHHVIKPTIAHLRHNMSNRRHSLPRGCWSGTTGWISRSRRLIVDETKIYAPLFTDDDRVAATAKLKRQREEVLEIFAYMAEPGSRSAAAFNL